MPTLTVRRDKGWTDKFRNYRILVDGEEIGRLGEGEHLCHPIAAGLHVVEAKIDWCGSRPAFRDPHPEVREHAAMWAGRMRAQGEGVVPALVDLVQSDPAFEVRVQAARSLGQIGPAAASALPALRSVKENENEHRRVRGFAIRAIFRITDKSRDRR